MCPIDWENCSCDCHTSPHVKHFAACCCVHQKKPAMCAECNPTEDPDSPVGWGLSPSKV